MVRSKGGGSHLRARASEPSSLGLVLVTCARSGSPDPASGGTTGGRTFSGVGAPGTPELTGDEVEVGAAVGGLGDGATDVGPLEAGPFEVGPFEVGRAGAAAIGVGIAALVRKLVSILSKARGVTLPSRLPVPDPASEAFPVPIPIVAPWSVPHWEQTFDSD